LKKEIPNRFGIPSVKLCLIKGSDPCMEDRLRQRYNGNLDESVKFICRETAGTWFKNAIYPLVITSLIFGLLHGFNPEVDKLGNIILVYYIATGLLFGITTLMDDGTELALGMHAANNIVASVLVTSDWMVFQTDALWKDISEPSAGVETFVPVLLVYPVVLLILSKKYGWKNWKSKLFAPVHKPVEHIE
jgi:hypothetical protein